MSNKSSIDFLKYYSVQKLCGLIWDDMKHRVIVLKRAKLESVAASVDTNVAPVLCNTPFVSHTFCLITQVPGYMRKWCHRDKIAKERLEEFLSEEWEIVIAEQMELNRDKSLLNSTRF